MRVCISHTYTCPRYICAAYVQDVLWAAHLRYICAAYVYTYYVGLGPMDQARWAGLDGPGPTGRPVAGLIGLGPIVYVHLHNKKRKNILVFATCRKISIQSDVILSALDLHDDKTELTSSGGTVMSLPAQHPLILSATPPAMWGKGSGVFSSHKG
jgi:hypothetical protein